MNLDKVASYQCWTEKELTRVLEIEEDIRWAYEQTQKAIERRKTDGKKTRDYPKFYLYYPEIGGIAFMFTTHELDDRKELEILFKNNMDMGTPKNQNSRGD